MSHSRIASAVAGALILKGRTELRSHTRAVEAISTVTKRRPSALKFRDEKGPRCGTDGVSGMPVVASQTLNSPQPPGSVRVTTRMPPGLKNAWLDQRRQRPHIIDKLLASVAQRLNLGEARAVDRIWSARRSRRPCSAASRPSPNFDGNEEWLSASWS